MIIDLLKQIAIMILLMLVGMVSRRYKIITEAGNASLSGLLLYVITPLFIISAFNKEYDPELTQGLLITIVLTAVSMVLMIVLSNLFIRDKHKQYRMERFCAAYSNCGFIGLPLINGLFGKVGVFYLTGVIAVFNLTLWTHGLITMQGSTGTKPTAREILRQIVNPTVVACVIGFSLYMLRIPLPEVVASTCNYIGSMTTPVGMLIAGVVLAASDPKRLTRNRRLYFVIFLKQILYPVILLLLFRFLPLDPVLLLTVIITMSCPTASACTSFAIQFDQDAEYTSEIFAASTIASVATLPLLIMLNTALESLFHLAPV